MPPRKSADDDRRKQLAAGERPVWLLLPSCEPVLFSCRKTAIATATHFAREGDTTWRPIAELAFTEARKGA